MKGNTFSFAEWQECFGSGKKKPKKASNSIKKKKSVR